MIKIKKSKFCRLEKFYSANTHVLAKFHHSKSNRDLGKNKTRFFKFCTILDFLVNFTLNYEGFADFSILPFDNERVFFNSVKSNE